MKNTAYFNIKIHPIRDSRATEERRLVKMVMMNVVYDMNERCYYKVKIIRVRRIDND